MSELAGLGGPVGQRVPGNVRPGRLTRPPGGSRGIAEPDPEGLEDDLGGESDQQRVTIRQLELQLELERVKAARAASEAQVRLKLYMELFHEAAALCPDSHAKP